MMRLSAVHALVVLLLILGSAPSLAVTEISFANLTNDPLANGELDGSEFNSLGLDLTFSGLALNAGCGTGPGLTCLGVDDVTLNDFSGRMLGTFVMPGTHIPALVSFLRLTLCCESATLGTVVKIYDAAGNAVSTIIGADVTFFSVPVSYFDIRFLSDALVSVTYVNIQPLPEPSTALLLVCGVVVIARRAQAGPDPRAVAYDGAHTRFF